PTILMGAILPPLGNFLYADLADGAPMIDGFAHLLRLDALARAFGSDERMMRLLLAICYENVTVGLALTAFVAYVSSIVSRNMARSSTPCCPPCCRSWERSAAARWARPSTCTAMPRYSAGQQRRRSSRRFSCFSSG